MWKFVQGLSPQWKVRLLSSPCFKALEEFIIEFSQKKIVDFVMGESLRCGEKKHSGAKCAKSVFGKNCAKVPIL